MNFFYKNISLNFPGRLRDIEHKWKKPAKLSFIAGIVFLALNLFIPIFNFIVLKEIILVANESTSIVWINMGCSLFIGVLSLAMIISFRSIYKNNYFNHSYIAHFAFWMVFFIYLLAKLIFIYNIFKMFVTIPAWYPLPNTENYLIKFLFFNIRISLSKLMIIIIICIINSSLLFFSALVFFTIGCLSSNTLNNLRRNIYLNYSTKYNWIDFNETAKNENRKLNNYKINNKNRNR